MDRDLERFFTRFEVDPATGCWQWSAPIADPSAYARMRVGDRVVRAHRFAYQRLVGPIAEGLEIDHLCRNRRCVNPGHLEAVPHRVNTRRGVGPTAVNARKSACINGHEFTPENTYLRSDGRQCRACGREGVRRYRMRKRESKARVT